LFLITHSNNNISPHVSLEDLERGGVLFFNEGWRIFVRLQVPVEFLPFRVEQKNPDCKKVDEKQQHGGEDVITTSADDIFLHFKKKKKSGSIHHYTLGFYYRESFSLPSIRPRNFIQLDADSLLLLSFFFKEL
jgi:hypothetical protein